MPASPRQSRRSQRLGADRPDFKALSSRGRDSAGQSSAAGAGPEKKAEFHQRQTFASYDDLMRFAKQYETQHAVRLNASMITPDQRLAWMRDSQYYRFVTFWCNYNPNFPLKQSSMYTPLDRRFCPFFVRAQGNEAADCLVVAKMAGQHSHTDRNTVLGPPKLPTSLRNADPIPAAGIFHPRPCRRPVVERQRLGKVVKPRHAARPKGRPKTSKAARREVKEVARERRPEMTQCGLCERACVDMEALVGHVWLAHGILTEAMSLR